MSEKYVRALYEAFDGPNQENVIPFLVPLGQESQEILDDIHALLEDPLTCKYAKDVLLRALHHIGTHFVGEPE